MVQPTKNVQSNPHSSPEDKLARYRGWRRHTIGALAAVLLIISIGLLVGRPDGGNEGMASFGLRVGLVLGALWLALPQLGAIFAKYPPWLIITFLVLIGVIVVQPKMLIYLVPLLGVLLALKFFGWFTRPLAPSDGKRQPASRNVSAPPDSRSTPESTSGKGG